MHEGVVEEARRLVVGDAVLVEEDEGVDLAGGQVQVLARVGLEAVVHQRDLELVPGLGQDGEGIVGAGVGLEGGGVGGAGIGGTQADAGALAEAEVGEDLALGVAHFAAGQRHGEIAAIAGASFVGAARRVAGADALHDAGQAAADLDAFERLGEFLERTLHCQRLRFRGLEPGSEFGFLFGNAFAGECLLQRLVLLLQGLDTGGEALHFRQHGGQVVGHGGHGEAGRQQGGDQIAAHDQ
ncbi:MAG: hypothetical protein V9E90_08960 [Saprospiraceae bacterium]